MTGMASRRAVLGAGFSLVATGMSTATFAASSSLDALIERWCRDTGFAGVIATARRGRVRTARAVGLASIEDRLPMTVGTRFAIGSISKWFTTLAVLRLAEKGVLSIDQPIGRHLSLRSADMASRVRIADLLANRSGIPDRLSRAARDDRSLRSTTRSADDLVAAFADGPLERAPDTLFDYSATNWLLVRAIIEHAAGAPFEAVVEREVFRPLGLRRTSIARRGFALEPSLAPAYGSIDPPVRKADPVPPALAASGTFVSDAADMLRAPHLVFGARFLSRQSLAALTAVHSGEEGYALGGRVRMLAGRRWAWETGKIGGYRSHLAHDIERDRGIIVLGNTDIAQDRVGQLVEHIALIR